MNWQRFKYHLLLLDFWESSSESELSQVLHSLELELDDPELELSELKPVGLFRSTLSAMAATSERSFYKIKYSHLEIKRKLQQIKMKIRYTVFNISWIFLYICMMLVVYNFTSFSLKSKNYDITLTLRTLYHFLDSLGLPLTVLCQTIGKFTTLQKFWVTAIVLSKFRTTCHHPPGTNTVSPGPWRISNCHS